MRLDHFHVTAHAQQREVERCIDHDLMINIVMYPDSKKQLRRGRHGGIVYQFTRKNSDGVMVVIAEVCEPDAWLITAYRTA